MNKKYRNLFFVIAILVFSFSFHWYSDQLIDLLFGLTLIINLILVIIYTICLLVTLKAVKNNFNIINFVTILILILTLVLILFFPFRETKTKLELNLYEKDRLEVVEMIKNKKLIPDEFGNVKLPKGYEKISTSKEVTIYKCDSKTQVISFYIFRGMLSGSTELIYSPSEELIRENVTLHPIKSIRKLKDNWYYVETDY